MSVDIQIHKRILESLRDGVMTVDLNGRVMSFNRAAEQILGIQKSEILFQPFGDWFLVRHENDDFTQAILDAVYEQKAMHHNLVPYYTGSEYRTLSITTSFLSPGAELTHGDAVVVVFSDMTEVEKLKTLAITDVLTGAWNRAYLQDNLPREIKRALRYQHPLSVVITDIDFFKKVNDTYGHHAGDVVLKGYVNSIKDFIRVGVDWIARYGGEEFVLVLPETGGQGALEVAQRIRKSVAATVFEAGEHRVRITGSFGVTTIEDGFQGDVSESALTAERMVQRADQFLYQAKTGGRNRVVGPF